MDKVKQKRLKTLSSVISIFSTIGKVFCFIGIACMLLLAVVVPFMLKGVNLKKHEIKIADQVVKYEVNDDDLTVYVNGKKQDADFKLTGLNEIVKDLEGIKTSQIVTTSVVFSVGEILILILMVILLSKISRLFKNISKEDTPFTNYNTLLIHEIANVLVLLFVAPIVLNIVLNLLISNNINLNVNFVSITLILIAYAASIIFEYGTKLQEKAKLSIYE